MVLRRCATIVVIDGSADPGYNCEDLGNAIRKIRVDLGIPIDFCGGIPIRGPRDVLNRYCAVGTIGYNLADESCAAGRILYIKACLNGTEPRDVQHYAEDNPDFPQQGTEQLWFDEAQFESYRSLGLHMIQRIWGSAPTGAPGAGPVEELINRAESFVGGVDVAPHSRWPQPAKSSVKLQGKFRNDSISLNGTLSEE